MKAGPDGVISKKHVVIRIPGEIFHPLGPNIYWKDDNPFWALSNSSLAEIMEHAWNELNPESDEILSNIDLLPEVLETSDLPYQINQNHLSGLIIDSANLLFNIQTNRFDPGAVVPCYLCPQSLKLRDMRNHVGKHILKALRDCQDTLKEGIVVSTQIFHCDPFKFNFLDWTQPMWLVWALATVQDSVDHKRKIILNDIKL